MTMMCAQTIFKKILIQVFFKFKKKKNLRTRWWFTKQITHNTFFYNDEKIALLGAKPTLTYVLHKFNLSFIVESTFNTKITVKNTKTL